MNKWWIRTGYSPQWLTLAIALIATFNPQISWAVLTENLAIGSPRALALANAVTADPPGISSVHFNPAGLTLLEGRQQSFNFIYAQFEIGLEFGERTETRQQLLDQAEQIGIDLGVDFPNGFFEDEAYQASSTTEGVTAILPGVGMTDMALPITVVGGASYQPPGSKITFATSAHTPMVAGFYRDDNDPGRFIGQRLAAMVLTYFSPTVAIEVTDNFSFGAGISFNYAGIGLELPLRVPHLAHLAIPLLQVETCDLDTPVINICEDLPLYDQLGLLEFEVDQSLAFGYNAGFLWKVYPWLTIGASYQAPIKLEMEGSFRWENSNQWIDFINPLKANLITALALDAVGIEGEKVVKGDASMALTMPEHYSMGISLQLTPSIRLNMDYKYAGWSSWDEFAIELSEASDLMAIASIGEGSTEDGVSLIVPLGMKDTWNFAYGIEYQYNDQLALRFGAEDRPTSIPGQKQSPLLPLGDGTLYGLGFGYETLTGTKYDVAISYFKADVSMPGNTSDFGNSEDPLKLIYNPYPGQDIEATTTIMMFEMGIHRQF